MVNNWKIQRKEGRVAVRMPITLELETPDNDGFVVMESVAENISRDGFLLSIKPDEEHPFNFQVGQQYPVHIRYGRKKLKATIRIMWTDTERYGVMFVEREKGWIVN